MAIGASNGASIISPPLILSFVAIGVFAVMALLLCYSRRMRAIVHGGAAAYGQGVSAFAGFTPGALRHKSSPWEHMEPPKLWEVEVVGTAHERLAWKDIQPFSARVERPPSAAPASAQPPSNQRRPSALRGLLPRRLTGTDAGSDEGTMDLAVTILMPSQSSSTAYYLGVTRQSCPLDLLPGSEEATKSAAAGGGTR